MMVPPIIDVKPYSHPGIDDVRVPDWVLRLRREMNITQEGVDLD